METVAAEDMVLYKGGPKPCSFLNKSRKGDFYELIIETLTFAKITNEPLAGSIIYPH